ncbi:quinone oxidoreductase family protein [Corynebacterium urinipleomorphum]|uniref:quinone oxidoreductase family protein n=1 Tax=Corynebacterium urinipleomorphum TaxID=1852380 RepID=UPI000B360289|nr:quinone oxidoreductase [Corynebacterium urinipleomorphum]
MKAIQITENGGPDVLVLADVPAPTPSPDQVLVKVAYAGVNYIDTYYREGIYHSELPFIPGLEGCGEVVEDPTGEIAPGTVVAWDSAPGSYAEYVCVDRNRLVAVPDSIPASVAATMFLQGITAHYLLYGVRDTKEGDTLLITAGAGGVGLLLTQLAAAQGATVYSVVSTDEKEKLAYDAGATEVFRYSDDLAEMVRRRNGGRGVDVVYDGVGKDTFGESLEAVRPRGLVCLFGAASGPVDPIDPQLLNTHGSIFLTRPSIGAYTATDDEFRMRAQAVVRAVDDGTLTLRVQEPYALSHAAQAHKDLQGRKTTGSIVLKVAD